MKKYLNRFAVLDDSDLQGISGGNRSTSRAGRAFGTATRLTLGAALFLAL